MHVAARLVTPLPDWYEKLDPSHRYVGVLDDPSPLNDGYSLNGQINVSTHDTKRIITDSKTFDLSHDMPVMHVPDYEWYQDLVMVGEHSTSLRTEHLYDLARNQSLQVTSASGIVNDPSLLNSSVIYARNDPNLVDGDNVQVRLGADEQVAAWPDGASQHLTVTLTTGVQPGSNAWHNTSHALDVDNDTHVAPNDALAVINYLNSTAPKVVPADAQIGQPYGFIDVDADRNIAPNDALFIINFINAQGGDADGEQSVLGRSDGQTMRSVQIDALFALLATTNDFDWRAGKKVRP